MQTVNMKKSLVLLSAYMTMFLSFVLVGNILPLQKTKNLATVGVMPAPTENPSNIKEDGDKEKAREKWFEAMHRAAPGVDWREIELSNQKQIAANRLSLLSKIGNRSTIEYFADSTVVGQWYERGARDVTGSQVYTDYDPETDYLYSVAAGGSIFKGTSNGVNWHPINQEFQFDERFIRVYQGPSSKRLTCVLNKKFVNSDDEGQSWKEVPGQNISGNIDQNKDFLILNNADKSGFFLAREKNTGSSTYTLRLYQSFQKGDSLKMVKNLGNVNYEDYEIVNPGNTNDLYLFIKSSSSTTSVSKWDFASNDFVLLNNGNFGIGDNFAFKVTAAKMDDHVRFYLFNKNMYVFYTDDFGKSWETKGKLPIAPWGVGIFCFKSDPTHLVMGEVECYKSDFSGSVWQKVSGWGEYYGNVKARLHADMMHFNEFQKKDGSYFGVICCHGGIFKTTNYTVSVENITLEHLNNAQYYDVSTQPGTFDYIYAGAQDQGFQRSYSPITEKDAASFTQVISGDYGHNCFTKKGAGLWTVYPGGSISYYNDPKSGGVTAWYELKSDNETVWIPPIVPGPNADNAHEVLLAGGNPDGGAGSYLIRLKYKAGNITASKYPFDFKANSGSEISAIAISPLDTTRMYVATNNGKFYTSDDAGTTWYQSFMNVPGSHYLYGACIYPSRLNKDVVYVSGSGYSNAAVLKSDDGGTTFNAMSNGLPPTLVFNVAANDDESLFFAASQSGPYVYSVAKNKWYNLSGVSAPTQTYWSVDFIEGNDVVRFGTYGRGIWDFRINDLTTASIDVKTNIKEDIKIWPNPVVSELNVTIPNKDIVNIEIYTLNGQFISNKKNVQNQASINVSSLKPGSYVVSVKGKQNTWSKVFVKK